MKTLRFADSNSDDHVDIPISEQELVDYIADMAHEKLIEDSCDCSPVGETNVIECGCQEHFEEKYKNYYLSEVI